MVANNDINLGENGKITIINGQLNGDSISGVGNIIMDESSYLYLDNSYLLIYPKLQNQQSCFPQPTVQDHCK